MQKKYSYSEKYNEKLEQYLRHHGIRYRIAGDGCLVPRLVCFAVYDEASRLREFQNTVHSKPIITNEFTQREHKQMHRFLIYEAGGICLEGKNSLIQSFPLWRRRKAG